MHAVAAVDGNHGRYYAELQALKEAPETKMMFDEDTLDSLGNIQSNIMSCKKLTVFQQLIRYVFFAGDVFLVTPETMPEFHEYVEGVCKKANIDVPTIFITRKKLVDPAFFTEMARLGTILTGGIQQGMMYALAQKLLVSSGAVIIEQKFLQELSDEGLEAVVTHEIGHIKHNHIYKSLALGIVVTYLVKLAMAQSGISDTITLPVGEQVVNVHTKDIATGLLVWGIIALIINKRFEKQADEFAYADNGKANGIIEVCELFLKKEQIREEEFVVVYNLLQANRASLPSLNYYSLLAYYYMEKCFHKIEKFKKFIRHETFWGLHPSDQARIAAAREYLAQQQQ